MVQAQYSGKKEYSLAAGQTVELFRVHRIDDDIFFMFCHSLDAYNIERLMEYCQNPHNSSHVYIGTAHIVRYLGIVHNTGGRSAHECHLILD